MIVKLKKLIAAEIAEILNKVKILTSDFTENEANRAQSNQEVRVLYTRSVWNKQQQTRTLEYRIILKIKNLRDDDLVQDVTDSVCYGLRKSKIFGRQLELVTDSNSGFSNGFWEYEIIARFNYPADEDLEDCLTSPPVYFKDMEITIYPTYDDFS